MCLISLVLAIIYTVWSPMKAHVFCFKPLQMLSDHCYITFIGKMICLGENCLTNITWLYLKLINSNKSSGSQGLDWKGSPECVYVCESGTNLERGLGVCIVKTARQFRCRWQGSLFKNTHLLFSGWHDRMAIITLTVWGLHSSYRDVNLPINVGWIY